MRYLSCCRKKVLIVHTIKLHYLVQTNHELICMSSSRIRCLPGFNLACLTMNLYVFLVFFLKDCTRLKHAAPEGAVLRGCVCYMLVITIARTHARMHAARACRWALPAPSSSFSCPRAKN